MPEDNPVPEAKDDFEISAANIARLAGPSKREKDPGGRVKLVLFLVGAVAQRPTIRA